MVSRVLFGGCDHQMHYECAYSLRFQFRIAGCPACSSVNEVTLVQRETLVEVSPNFGDTATEMAVYNGTFNVRSVLVAGDVTKIQRSITAGDLATPVAGAPGPAADQTSIRSLIQKAVVLGTDGGTQAVPENARLVAKLGPHLPHADLARLMSKQTIIDEIVEMKFTAKDLATSGFTVKDVIAMKYTIADIGRLPDMNFETLVRMRLAECMITIDRALRVLVLEDLVKEPYSMTFTMFFQHIMLYFWSAFRGLEISAEELRIIGFNSNAAENHHMPVASWKYLKHLDRKDLDGKDGLITDTYMLAHREEVSRALKWDVPSNDAGQVSAYGAPYRGVFRGSVVTPAFDPLSFYRTARPKGHRTTRPNDRT